MCVQRQGWQACRNFAHQAAQVCAMGRKEPQEQAPKHAPTASIADSPVFRLKMAGCMLMATNRSLAWGGVQT